MSIYKRVSGNLVVETVGNTDSVTFQGATANTATVIIDGNLTVTGNASLSGNIAGDKIFNGTTSIEIPVASGNATVSIGGTSNVAVYATTGEFVTGLISATGNITGGNLLTAGLVSAAGNVIGGNIDTAGNIVLTRLSTATTTPIFRFTDSNTAVTTLGANIGAVEWFTSDATGAGARVTAAVKAVYADTSGNANVLIQTASGASLTNRIVVLGATGNVGIANSAPLHTLAVTGTMYGSSTLDVVGNVAGGNVSTAGLVTATGNVTGGNLQTAGIVSATGNIIGANISVAGGVIGGAGGVSVTGNITGGNLIINGTMSASGNLATTDISATTLSASGNVTGGNVLTGGLVSATGNVTGGNITTGAQVVATGNVTGANINTGGLISASGNINGLNVNTGLVSATGNIVSAPGSYFIGDGGFLSNVTVVSNVAVSQLANGTTNWTIRGSGGNITADIAGSPNVIVFYSGGIDITGAFSAAGNIVGANINTLGLVSATGNITGGNVAGATGTFTTVIGAANATSLTSGTVPSDRLTGQYTIDINGNATVANTVALAAQPNITSVGTLTSLTVTGNITGGNVLVGSGQITTTGNITGGNVLVGSGQITTTGNITGGNVLAGSGQITTTGNITGGNISTAGNLAAPTAAQNTNTTQVATTAFVIGQASSTTPTSIGTNTVGTATTFARADHTHTGVSSITTSSGLSTNTGATGAVAITNTGVTSIVAGTNIAVSAATGTVTISVTGTVASATTAGTVTTAAQPNITSVGTLSSLAVTANIDGGNLRTAGLISATGQVTGSQFNGSGAGLSSIPGGNVTGTVSSATTAGTVTTAAQPNITSVGTLSSVTVSGNITGGNLSVSTGTVTAGNIVNSNANGVGNIGSSSTYFNRVFATATTALYADLAEKFLADQPYQPGTVLIFGGDLEVTQSVAYADHRVAGVVSTNPSYLMNSGLGGQYGVELALQGRVPCAVEGPVEKGDLLVSAPNGRARAVKTAQAGTIVGKSLEHFSGETGTIEIVVGRD